MNKIYMYAHGGSGNHGCEAIVRSTVKLLNNIYDGEKILISSNPEEDKKYNIDHICTILKDQQEYSKCSIDFVKAYFDLKIKKNYISMDKLPYQQTIKKVKEGDIALSIGGDNYCYADVDRYIMLHDMFLKQGAKTVLWGCSVEPDLVQIPKFKKDLERYSLITARETISYEALQKVNPNTVLISDPAFNLDLEENILPEGFLKDNMVGINISPMVIKNEVVEGIAMKNYESLISYLLNTTNMGIALIPHVIWDENDDRIPLTNLYNKFKDSGRVILVQDQNCEKLKGIIAKCRFFVGARTHSTIAAYSSGIPTLVVGYSVKARGIARDIFGKEDNYVIPVQKIRKTDELKKAFIFMINNEKIITQNLERYMDCTKNKYQQIIETLKALENK